MRFYTSLGLACLLGLLSALPGHAFVFSSGPAPMNEPGAKTTSAGGSGGGGTGDITAVGNCGGGACLNGSSSGGSTLSLYDGDSNKGTMTPANLTADRLWTFPNETGTVCTTGSVCTGYQASLGFTAVANTVTVNGQPLSSNVTLTKTDISLSNITDDAQLKRSANDFTSFTAKASPISSDILLIEDSAAGGVKKYVSVSSLVGSASGDITTVGTCLTGDCFTTGTPSNSLFFAPIAAPSTPAASRGIVYVDSTSKNLAVKDDAGVVKHGVQTKAAVSNSFATAIDDAGVVTVAQPAFSNLSGSAACGQLPALTGGVTTSAGSCATTIVTTPAASLPASVRYATTVTILNSGG